MKLKDQVTSLELSKKLKELGVEQESLWYWVHPWQKHKYVEDKSRWILTTNYLSSRINGRTCISAFTVAELGEMLPEVLQYEGEILRLLSRCKNYISYEQPDRGTCLNQYGKSESNARATMLIYLKEEKLIK